MNAEETPRRALEWNADVVLVDVAQPEDVLWRLIDHGHCSHIGRVVVTRERRRVPELLKLCVDAVVVKLFEPLELVDVVRDVAKVARRRRRGALLLDAREARRPTLR